MILNYNQVNCLLFVNTILNLYYLKKKSKNRSIDCTNCLDNFIIFTLSNTYKLIEKQ